MFCSSSYFNNILNFHQNTKRSSCFLRCQDIILLLSSLLLSHHTVCTIAWTTDRLQYESSNPINLHDHYASYSKVTSPDSKKKPTLSRLFLSPPRKKYQTECSSCQQSRSGILLVRYERNPNEEHDIANRY